jgi:hypothetical protein
MFIVRVCLVVATLSGSPFVSRAFAQLPPPTNPNLVRLGYYFVNEQYGDDTAYVWPYTNLYVALPLNAVPGGDPNWDTAFAAQLQKATVNHKAIWLGLGACVERGMVLPNDQTCTLGYDDILNVAASYWDQIVWVELGEEGALPSSSSGMTSLVNSYLAKLSAHGLSYRAPGITLSRSQLVPQMTDAVNAPGVAWVNIEAFESPSVQNQSASSLVDDLENYLNTAKTEVASAGKQVFLTMQAYDVSGAWTNMDTLAALQEPVYLEAYADPSVIGILMFSYNRTGGTKDHANVLQQSHREIGSIMGLTEAGWVDTPGNGSTPNEGFVIGGWSIDLAATDSPQSSGHGTGVDSVVVWATPTNGNPATFVGVAAYGVYRPDVGAIYGSQFTSSGWNLTAPYLTPGQYWLSVYPHSSITGTYMRPMVIVVTVQ